MTSGSEDAVLSAHTAKRLASAAAYGGSGAGVIGMSTVGLLVVEGMLARRTVGAPAVDALDANGVYGAGAGEPLQLLVLGDSAAAGLGVDRPEETPGVLLALELAAAAQRPVCLASAAVVGARSEHLSGQLRTALEYCPHPDVTVIIVGANDVTHVRPLRESVQALAEAIRQLRTTGSEVVIGTCPDLGTIQPIAQPLRALARSVSRRLAAMQAVAAVEGGARAVSLGDLLGEEFARYPEELFGPDRFHPSATGYGAAVDMMMPAVRTAAGLEPSIEESSQYHPHSVLPVHVAAAEAARDPGAQVAGGHIDGRQRGPRGRFAALRRRLPLTRGETAVRVPAQSSQSS
ncbi:MAG: SGNH/GDSL hydrolase family protein [Streptosporangiales bacterium]